MPHRDTTTPAWRASLAMTTATPLRHYDSDTARGAMTATRRRGVTKTATPPRRYDSDTAHGATTVTQCRGVTKTATWRVALRHRHGTWCYDIDTARGATTSTRRVALRHQHSVWRYDSDTACGATTATRRCGVTKTAPRHGEDNDTAPPYGEDSNTVPRHGEYGDTAPWPLVYKSIVTVLVLYTWFNIIYLGILAFRIPKVFVGYTSKAKSFVVTDRVRFGFNPSPNLNRTNVNLNQWFGSGFGLDP
ncbi:hypothetical protein EDB84DRAFT_1627540 [Lactarius hengduanensis]|nr:hypothetical protein EDB84DRAFT_1627540 [Lactarius hengduanensis]